MFLIVRLEKGEYQYWNMPSEWWTPREEAATRYTLAERENYKRALPLHSFWVKARP